MRGGQPFLDWANRRVIAREHRKDRSGEKMDCRTGKIPYSTRKEAVAFVKRSHVGAVRGGNRPYRCPDCGWWHLGRKLTREQQRQRRRYMEGRFEDERSLNASD